ncbi:DsbA family protein [Vineibacter terrae]|uniref:DsbA family protein n=1 Tax=Vineibacter terrae TaxID=2586908 RepID=UPI002E324978|nr:DsbA family protein [Vineibacter terrae]HEX2889503.1 DsbA family protein [Vineibacter terrae]
MHKILILAGAVLGAATFSLPSAAPLQAAPIQLAQTVPAELQPSADDHVMGNPDAAVTIVEYASMTCPHCADFHTQILPELKKKYVDTGKVRFVYRDFPLDQIALQAAQISECSGKDRYFGVVDVIFRTQAQWAASKDPIAELGKTLRIAGITEADIKTCIADQKLATTIVTERQVGEKAGVNATPTLFINGQRWNGARTVEALDEALGKLIK